MTNIEIRFALKHPDPALIERILQRLARQLPDAPLEQWVEGVHVVVLRSEHPV